MSDLEGTIIESDWDNIALEDGSLVDEHSSYEAKIYPRDTGAFDTLHTQIENISYTPEVNAAKPITIDVEPFSELENTNYMGGIVDVYVDGDPLFSGDIVKINLNQNDDFYSIKAEPPGKKLRDQTINESVSEVPVADFIAKTIDKYNDWHSEYNDKKNTFEESLTDVDKRAGNRVATSDNAEAIYKSIGANGCLVDFFYVKVETNNQIVVTLETTNGSSYTETLTGLDEGSYGQWHRIEPSGLDCEYYDVYFEMEAESVLYDWISVTSDDIRREVEPTTTDVVAQGETIQDAPSTDSFSSLVTPSDTQPFGVTSSEVYLQKSLYIDEAESDTGSSSTLDSIAASDGSYAWFVDDIYDTTVNFGTEYKIPESEVYIAHRNRYQYIDDWSALNLAWAFGGFDVKLDGTTVTSYAGYTFGYFGQDGPLEKQDGVYAYDSGSNTETEETAAANNDTADDMTLLPSSPSAGDKYYWWHDGEFDEIEIDISQPGNGTWNIVWEYYAEEYDSNDNLVTEEWREIPGVVDGTNGFQSSGSVTWFLDDIASDTQNGGDYVVWAEDSTDNNSVNNQFIRARLDSFTSMSQQPLGRKSRCRGGPFDWNTDGSWSNGDLPAGSHSVTIDCTDPDALQGFDVICLYDNRFSYNFGNDVHQENGYLDGPQQYPNSNADSKIEFKQAASSDNITKGYIDVQTDAANVASLQLRFADGQWFGSNFVTSIQATNPGTSSTITGRLGLQRYSPNGAQSATPRFGYDGQNITDWKLSVDTDSLAVFTSQDFSDNRLSVVSTVADENDVFFRFEGNLAKIFERGQLQTNPNLKKESVSSDISIEDVYKSCEVIGEAGVTSGVIEDASTPGYITRHAEIRDPDITTEDDARRKARSFLSEHGTVNFGGNITTLPTRAPLGEEIVGTTFNHGKNSFIKSVRYGKRNATIDCGREKRVFDEIIKLDRDVEATKKRDTK